jgi:hypothetical protein
MKFHFLNILLVLGFLTLILVLAFSPAPAHFNDDFQKQSKIFEHQHSAHNLCDDLPKQMQSIDNKRTFLAIEQINNNLRLCLPLMSSSEQFKMMQISEQMYQNFLQVTRNEQQKRAFNHLATLADPLTLQKEQEFALLHPRDQYLLKHQRQHFIHLMQTQEGDVYYQRDPEFFLNHFAAYLHPNQAVFKNLVQ